MPQSRDEYIVQDYSDGKDIREISRSYGLSSKRVIQILDENEVDRRPQRSGTRGPLSEFHRRLGLHLYNFRYDKGLEPVDVANKLGWSIIKLRKVEQGTTELELLDILDVESYTKTPLSDILKGAHAG